MNGTTENHTPCSAIAYAAAIHEHHIVSHMFPNSCCQELTLWMRAEVQRDDRQVGDTKIVHSVHLQFGADNSTLVKGQHGARADRIWATVPVISNGARHKCYYTHAR